jgi:hypothetical protein
MSRQTFPINSSNLTAIKAYIRQQFDRLSWWPTQGTLQAKEEFERLPDTPEALVEWCEKWLDGGQWRQLKIAVQNAPPDAIG